MIIDENELMESFSDGDDVGYAFLISNAEDEEQIGALEKLSEIYKAILASEESIEENFFAYEEARNAMLMEEIGLSISLIVEINCLTNF